MRPSVVKLVVATVLSLLLLLLHLPFLLFAFFQIDISTLARTRFIAFHTLTRASYWLAVVVVLYIYTRAYGIVYIGLVAGLPWSCVPSILLPRFAYTSSQTLSRQTPPPQETNINTARDYFRI